MLLFPRATFRCKDEVVKNRESMLQMVVYPCVGEASLFRWNEFFNSRLMSPIGSKTTVPPQFGAHPSGVGEALSGASRCSCCEPKSVLSVTISKHDLCSYCWRREFGWGIFRTCWKLNGLSQVLSSEIPSFFFQSFCFSLWLSLSKLKSWRGFSVRVFHLNYGIIGGNFTLDISSRIRSRSVQFLLFKTVMVSLQYLIRSIINKLLLPLLYFVLVCVFLPLFSMHQKLLDHTC